MQSHLEHRYTVINKNHSFAVIFQTFRMDSSQTSDHVELVLRFLINVARFVSHFRYHKAKCTEGFRHPYIRVYIHMATFICFCRFPTNLHCTPTFVYTYDKVRTYGIIFSLVISELES